MTTNRRHLLMFFVSDDAVRIAWRYLRAAFSSPSRRGVTMGALILLFMLGTAPSSLFAQVIASSDVAERSDRSEESDGAGHIFSVRSFLLQTIHISRVTCDATTQVRSIFIHSVVTVSGILQALPTSLRPIPPPV